MNNRICIILIFLIDGLLCTAQTSVTDKSWKHLGLPGGWHISVPEGFWREDARGLDSHVGTIYSLKDSVTLGFDIGTSNEIILDKVDCSLETLVRKAKQGLEQKSTKQIYNIPEVNSGYVDTINGRVAIIIVQQKSGIGLTYVHIKECESQNWITISVNYLPANKHDLVLKIFKSIDR